MEQLRSKVDSPPKLILASSSIYRQKLLKQLGLEFTCISPKIDETPLCNEKPIDLVKRLSIQKSTTIAMKIPDAMVIGSDQIAVFKGKILGKPEDFNSALKQLKCFSNNTIEFITGVSLTLQSRNYINYEESKVTVKFRNLSDTEIKQYLRLDQPFDCAGSFKIEAHGIRLFESVESNDPTSLQGLPLITVNRMLENSGYYEHI